MPDTKSAGRPTKLTQEFIVAASKVINDGDNALFFTDEDLLFLINEQLSADARISKTTFESWKRGQVIDDPEGEEFLRLIQKALLTQKRNVLTSLRTDEGQWTRHAWILERKF